MAADRAKMRTKPISVIEHVRHSTGSVRLPNSRHPVCHALVETHARRCQSATSALTSRRHFTGSREQHLFHLLVGHDRRSGIPSVRTGNPVTGSVTIFPFSRLRLLLEMSKRYAHPPLLTSSASPGAQAEPPADRYGQHRPGLWLKCLVTHSKTILPSI